MARTAQKKQSATIDLDPFQKAVNEAAARVRGLWLGFVALMAYLFIAVGAVKHVDLVLENPVKLPVLNVDLPLIGFFGIAPVFFLINHFYLLLMLLGLGRRIAEFNAELAKTAGDEASHLRERRKLDSFVIVQMLGGTKEEREGLTGVFLQTIAVITLVIAPLLLLLGIQVSFLPYQHETTTWLHRLMVIADLALLWLFWPAIRSGAWQPLRLPKAAYSAALAGSIVVFSAGFATFPGETVHRDKIVPVLDCLIGVKFDDSDKAVCKGGYYPLRDGLFSGPVDEISGTRQSPFSNALSLPNARLINVERLEKSLAKESKALSKSETLAARRTLSLRGRSLRGAVFDRADLRYVDLLAAKLDGASFVGAKLQGASLDKVTLKHAVLDGAHLTDASFLNADLREAFLIAANLTGARMDFANLRGARLDNADLTRATLQEAQLEGASLAGAKLQHVPLRKANLQGTNLQRAKLRAANIADANLLGADLSSATLMGADLSRAVLDGVNLRGAGLMGADLGNASLIGADLHAADLSAANLFAANLQGASLTRTQIVGASLHQAKLQGASLMRADLQGADLSGANLMGADLRAAKIGSAQFWSSRPFSETDLRWADLRKLVRKPFGQPAYERLVSRLRRSLEKEKVPERRLENVRQRVGKADDLEKARHSAGALCDVNSPPPVRECLFEDDIHRFDEALANVLASLGCGNAHVARSLVRNIFMLAELQYGAPFSRFERRIQTICLAQTHWPSAGSGL